jgi:hypothetical protein
MSEYETKYVEAYDDLLYTLDNDCWDMMENNKDEDWALYVHEMNTFQDQLYLKLFYQESLYPKRFELTLQISERHMNGRLIQEALSTSVDTTDVIFLMKTIRHFYNIWGY